MAGNTRTRRSARGGNSRWLIPIIVIAVVIVGAVALLVLDDSDEQADGPRSTTTTVTTTTLATTTTASTTTTTAPATTAATTTTAPPAITDPESAARALFSAWQSNDRTAAARAASQTAIDQMFSTAYAAGAGGANPWTLQPCGAAAGSLYCTWTTTAGNQIRMQVRTATGGLPIQVIDVARS